MVGRSDARARGRPTWISGEELVAGQGDAVRHAHVAQNCPPGRQEAMTCCIIESGCPASTDAVAPYPPVAP